MPTDRDLYRNGNANSPRMDNVRPSDVTIQNRAGVNWVVGGSGGISTFTRAQGPKNWWRLPAGAAVPNGADLSVPGHWLWEPEDDMTLTNYQQLLLQVGPWGKINLMEQEDLAENVPLSPAFAALSPKVARFLLQAVEEQLARQHQLMADMTDDQRSDLGNDSALYTLIQAQLKKKLSE